MKATVDVLIACFCYGGNGGVSSIIPELAMWLVRTSIKMKADPRIDRIKPIILSDTPITLTRNRAIEMAQNEGYDMVLMLDSDNEPDGYVGADPEAKPFWDVAFDFAYDRLLKGEPTVIAAPYCGPPPHPVGVPGVVDMGEVPYLFEWQNNETTEGRVQNKLEIMKRNEAARLKGIYPVAALPTGVCLFTTSSFEGLKKPYFRYEFNESGSEKQSTEDVVATRNISLFWRMTRNIDVIYAACDSWALHYKPKRVGKPTVTPIEAVAKDFREAIALNQSVYESKRCVDLGIPPECRPAEEVIEPTDIDDEGELPAAAELEKLVKANGKPRRKRGKADISALIRHKMVEGRKVAIIGPEVPDEELRAISSLGAWKAGTNGGAPYTAAVIGSDTGQEAAALLSTMPEGSHLYCIDCQKLANSGKEIGDQFTLSFSPELESGRVVADIDGRSFPIERLPDNLDIIFLRSVNGLYEDDEVLYRAITKLSNTGILAGGGYDSYPGKLADGIAKGMGANVRNLEGTGVWAIPLGVPTKN